MTAQSCWTELTKPPDAVFSDLLPLNDHEFIVVPQRHPRDHSYKDSKSIHKYNAISNEWTKVMDYPQNFKLMSHKSFIDTKNNMIYLCNDDSKLLQINLNTKKIKTLSNKANMGTFPGIFIINDKIHIIDAYQRHLVFNESNDKFDLIHDYKDDKMTVSNRPFYFTKTKSIINTFLRKKSKKSCPIIMEFKNNKWNDWKIENNQYIAGSRILATSREDYLIFMNGVDLTSSNRHDLIFVYDVGKGKLIKSDIELPKDSGKRRISCGVTRNNDKENLVTFGFINKCFGGNEYQNIQRLPFYLIKFIETWVCYETMHVIINRDSDFNPKERKHWIIDMDKIITSTLPH